LPRSSPGGQASKGPFPVIDCLCGEQSASRSCQTVHGGPRFVHDGVSVPARWRERVARTEVMVSGSQIWSKRTSSGSRLLRSERRLVSVWHRYVASLSVWSTVLVWKPRTGTAGRTDRPICRHPVLGTPGLAEYRPYGQGIRSVPRLYRTGGCRRRKSSPAEEGVADSRWSGVQIWIERWGSLLSACSLPDTVCPGGHLDQTDREFLEREGSTVAAETRYSPASRQNIGSDY